MSDSAAYQLYCDGACRGNPGPSAIGAVIYRGDTTIEEISEHIGVATNNEAEYRSLIRGLEAIRALTSGDGAAGADHQAGPDKIQIQVFMDSELVVRQVEGRYKVKNERLKPLYQQVRALLADFPDWSIRHVPRAKNAEADRLANAAYS
ncbi:MAG: ribonuclease HI family protein [bacterium]|nr:ribonuclease HI family protein [bacterium]